MKIRSAVPIRIAKYSYVAMSLVFCMLGIMFIVIPDISISAACTILGIVLCLFGISKIAGYLSKDLFRLAFQYDLELGIVMVILGVIMITHPFRMVNFIFIVIGLVVLTESLFKIRICLDARKFGIQLWWVVLTLSILSGFFGLMLLIRPWDSAQVLTVFLGITLLAEGLLNICTAFTMVRVVRNQYSDVIDMEYTDTDTDIPDQNQGV